jgi:hypothetical protein
LIRLSGKIPRRGAAKGSLNVANPVIKKIGFPAATAAPISNITDAGSPRASEAPENTVTTASLRLSAFRTVSEYSRVPKSPMLTTVNPVSRSSVATRSASAWSRRCEAQKYPPLSLYISNHNLRLRPHSLLQLGQILRKLVQIDQLLRLQYVRNRLDFHMLPNRNDDWLCRPVGSICSFPIHSPAAGFQSLGWLAYRYPLNLQVYTAGIADDREARRLSLTRSSARPLPSGRDAT